MQWLQDQSQSNVDFLNNTRHQDNRHFRKKKKAYLKAKIEELENNSMIKIFGNFTGASVTLRMVISLELI